MKRYVSNDRGQVAAITAIAALPLILGVSVAVDSHRVGLERTKLQSALDSAALAAVTDQTFTPAERSAHAGQRFWSNMSGEENVIFDVVSSDGQKIEIKAEMEIPTLFAGIIGRDSVAFKATSAAEVTKGKTVCMMALDPDSPKSFEMDFGGHLDANCAVQVNSVDDAAAFVQGGSVAKAQSFCVGGGASGDFEPFVNTECGILVDPYENLEIQATTEPCISETDLTALLDDWRSTRDAVDNHNLSQDEAVAEAQRNGFKYTPTYYETFHLQPGNYCSGLSLVGKELTLDPGEYHIGGDGVILTLGTQLTSDPTGEGVTFILYDDAKLEIENGSELNIKAPTSGPLEGLLFAQHLDNKSIYNPTFPNAVSTITSGSQLQFLGTVYLPSHRIEFVHGSGSVTHAPATSFIAHQIKITDDAHIVVSVDHVSAGISPIEPRSDDSARLVK